MNLAALEKHELVKYCIDLEKKNEALEIINKNSRAWVSLLSHDFKGIFASFVWLNNLYENGSISLEVLAELIPELKANAERNQRALNDSLLSVRFQYESLFNREDQFNLQELLLDIEGDLVREIKEKDLQIIYSGDVGTSVHSNKLMVKSILTKILDNAIKFSFNQKQILVDFKLLDDSRFRVRVQDFGTGVHPHNMNKLFTWDITAVAGTAGEKGAGLGLILSKEALLLLNGDIQISSSEHEGTIVEIVL